MSYSDSDSTPVTPDPSEEPAATDFAREQPDDWLPADVPFGDGENAIGATPPGFDWPTHGGYLGCLIGCLAAFLIGGFLGSVLLGTLYVVGGGTAVAMAVVGLIVYAGVAYGLCRLGWTLGKRFYRSYQEPGMSTWGEHDEFEYPVSEDAEDADAVTDVDAESADEPEMAPNTNGVAPESHEIEPEDTPTGLPLSSEGRRG